MPIATAPARGKAGTAAAVAAAPMTTGTIAFAAGTTTTGGTKAGGSPTTDTAQLLSRLLWGAALLTSWAAIQVFCVELLRASRSIGT